MIWPLAWLAVAGAQDAGEPDPPPVAPDPDVFVGIALGPDAVFLDRFWWSYGLRGAVLIDLWVLGLEVGGSLTVLDGPTRMTKLLDIFSAEPLIDEVGARGAVLGWFEPVRAEEQGWTGTFGIAGGVAGVVPAAGSGWIGPVIGPAWAVGAEARRDLPGVSSLGLRVRLEGAMYYATFPGEREPELREPLLQTPMWAGVDVVFGIP